MLTDIEAKTDNAVPLTVGAEPMFTSTPQTRCDGCSAQAYSVAIKSGSPSDLMFCGHHTRQHMDALLNSGWVVHTDTLAIDSLRKPV